MSLKNRLQRLQRLEGQGTRCPGCSMPPDGPRPIAVICEECPEGSFEGDPGETCARCGRPLYTVLRVVYDSAEGPDAA
jgi:hypothetical protein